MASAGNAQVAASDESSVAGDDSDEGLARRFVAGDERAFEQLVTRYKQRLFRFVGFSLGAARAEAEDVAQEILIQVYKSLPAFQGQSRLSTWLYGVAKNVCRHSRRALTSLRTEDPDEEALLEIPDVRLDPFRSLQRRETETAVRAAIDSLNPAQRVTVLLRDLEGFSYAEISAILGVPVGTVRSRLHNARVLLAERLAQRQA
jgi:RNA polymerase sigma-70 factor (ECF subfamily)